MKLKYVHKSNKKRKIILISIIVILINISFLLFKNILLFNESTVNPFDNVYFGYYNGKEKLESMPEKENPENLVFDHGECDNGASIEWDDNEWSPLVKNLSKSKTKCSIYFRKYNATNFLKDLATIDNKNLAYDGKKSLGELGTEDNNLRYIGNNPNNYVLFNNEIWRIIGVMKVLNENGKKEERLKIIRTKNISNQINIINLQYDKSNHNNWPASSLKNILNGIYFNSEIGDSYIDNGTYDFTQENGNPKGLDETARNMIDKDIIWNTGGFNSGAILTNAMYEAERGTLTGDAKFLYTWTKENDSKYHNGIGLLYPSDYGYAVGSESRNLCLGKKLYDDNGDDYRINDCKNNNWLIPSSGYYWTITPKTKSYQDAFIVTSTGYIGNSFCMNYVGTSIAPVIYLKSTVTITINPNPEQEYGSIDNPFRLSVS